MNRPPLVLDVAGVLTTNLSPYYWDELGNICGLPPSYIKQQFRSEIRERLWTGQITEQEYYLWLKQKFLNSTANLLCDRSLLLKHLRMLPAASYFEIWSRQADIHLLSNHRTEWLDELLRPYNCYLTSMTISNSVGICKPDLAIYEHVQRHLDNESIVFYVDDQDRNLLPARELGWHTFRADPEGQWIDKLRDTLSNW
ncbi:hypothetical protein EJP77_18515 [Paenibacillus zeisoli]|uniref:Haloacid dehalogenase n=1 Tax=Paenibacillus zeisoli TaxID=2496267 RepID=A0A3S1D3G8_9BACL|nr:hypothetical protein EJP77_18515 [Paenibacillus zeisoli]